MLNISNQVQYNLPESNEIEISLFGPGIGECLVVHLGNNEWMVVDSCIHPQKKRPTPLVYLEKLGVITQDRVKLFIITHWHSDHIRGASQVFENCKSARLSFSEALLKEEFLSLVSAYSGLDETKSTGKESTGTNEIASLIRILRNRCEKKSVNSLSPYIFSSADQRIYQRINKGIHAEVWALSPSSKSIMNSLIEIARLMPTPSESEIRKVIPAPNQNHNAIVLWIKFGEIINVLLGADLENSSDPLTGWTTIVNSPNRPLNKSKIFKIPHHGSSNAHSAQVWNEMLEKESIGILTSKIGGQSSIPKNSDIKTIKEFTPHIFGTLQPLYQKQKRDRIVEKTTKGIIKKRIPLNGEMGHIQIRIKKTDEINIFLKHPAVKY